ncbi:unnamed protein product [Cuscuta epithymum]|nr:unnamed protein product [Cuscuta epithymum]CAH9130979.1 unnamed protein product [Cuscuta epithymum]
MVDEDGIGNDGALDDSYLRRKTEFGNGRNEEALNVGNGGPVNEQDGAATEDGNGGFLNEEDGAPDKVGDEDLGATGGRAATQGGNEVLIFDGWDDDIFDGEGISRGKTTADGRGISFDTHRQLTYSVLVSVCTDN